MNYRSLFFLQIIAIILTFIFIPRSWFSFAKKDHRQIWLAGESNTASSSQELPCLNKTPPSWRQAQTIEKTDILASPLCDPDNPFEVAAFVQGTNNVDMETLGQTRLASDAVTKSNDRDGDGDPDDIHIRLEVVELNGNSTESEELIPQFSIAPGIRPGFWAFAPKTQGMATVNGNSHQAHGSLRMPSPPIRVEQGDRVKVTLENTHYLPHTIHLHGVDHPFKDKDGNGNDGVPMVSEMMLLPGEKRTYDLTPRHAGTMFYHCHVQPQSHILMGLNGLFIVEENRKNNWLQTLNIGAGHVRHPSVAIREKFAREYDLHYQDVDSELGAIIQRQDDAQAIATNMNSIYKVSKRVPDYFLLNGRSFPYTIRESLIVVRPDEKIKLRVLNAGAEGVSLHLHGHKSTITHFDGVPLPENGQIMRDVVWLSSAQRADLTINTTNDGLHSYGEGAWLMHDHGEQAVTSNGINPGGDVSMIVYESYLNESKMPKTKAPLDRFFDVDYYLGKKPAFMFFKKNPQMGPQKTYEKIRPYLALLCMGFFVGATLLQLLRPSLQRPKIKKRRGP